jgi:hypothetical protein
MAHVRRHADHAGAFASGLCLIHCLLMPALISLFPSLLPWLPGDALFHRSIVLGIVLVGALAFVPGYRIHRRHALLVLVATGMSLVLLVAWFGETMPRSTELALSIPGSLLLVAAHLLNRSFCVSCAPCQISGTCRTTQI